MDEELKKILDEFKTELIGIKIRLKRLEDFYRAFPNPEDYLQEHNYSRFDGRDDLFEEAVRMIAQHEMASVSLIQRRLQIGFNRAARLLEQLEEYEVVAPADGSKPRKVLVRKANEFLEKLKEQE